MANANDFESWLSGRLSHFNADGDVFSSYILGILDSEESQEEKETNLSDLLEGLGLDDGSPEPCERVQKEIWTQWNQVNSKENEKCEVKSDTVKAGATSLGEKKLQKDFTIHPKTRHDKTRHDNE